MNLKIIFPHFYERLTLVVAQELLGCFIVRRIGDRFLIGMICETEAYQGVDDPASHAFRGKTDRNFPMFGPCGMSYVYFTYGMHFCFNVVAKARDQEAGAVLIRAIKPIVGLEMMYQFRGGKIRKKDLTNGPAKLTQALAIDRLLSNKNLMQEGNLYIASQESFIKQKFIATSRIGIRVGQEKLWRFMVNEK